MTLATARLKRLFWARERNKARAKHTFYHEQSKRPEKERQALATKWHHKLDEATRWVTHYDRLIVSKQRANSRAAAASSGVTTFDGVPVAAVAVPYLQWARNHGWNGRLVSGWRDPKYSQSLCYRMCGRPSCPGKCAGTSSNHVGTTSNHFAVDVSDYQTFRRVIADCPISPRIFNNLPIDPVHFSPSGN